MRALVLAVVLALASGCAATAYGPRGTGRTGYSDLQVGPRTWEVTFVANGRTPPEQARRHALRRAAELVAGVGAECFVVTSRADDVAMAVVLVGAPDARQPVVVQRPTATLVATAAACGPGAYNAGIVLGAAP